MKLGHITRIKTGKLDANASSENGRYPFFTCARIPLKINRYAYDCECVLVAGNGDLNVKYYSGKFEAYQRTYIIESLDKTKLSTKYLFYFLSNYIHILRTQTTGGVIKFIKLGNLTDAQIPLLEATQQQRIVSELDNIEEGIRVKQEQLKTLDELIQSRFTEMFGKRFCSNLISLKNIADFTIGLTYKPENVSETGTIVLRSGNIQNNSLELKDDIIRVANIKIPDNKFVKENDILMCARNGSAKLVGKSCLISNLKEQMAFGAFMTIIRSRYPHFLQSFFTSSFFKAQLVNTATASVKQITSKMLGDYHVIQPTDEEENQFAEFVQKVEKAKEIVKIGLMCKIVGDNSFLSSNK